jgi:hypothetical protein
MSNGQIWVEGGQEWSGVEFATDGQSASMSWCRPTLWAHDQILHVLKSDMYSLLDVGRPL